MRKIYSLALFGSLAAFWACSSESSNSATVEEGSSSSVAVGDSTIVIVGDDKEQTVHDSTNKTVYVEDTTGKALHYVGNSALRITEVTPSSIDFLDHNGDDPGWVEIYNGGKEIADLRGYSIVENLAKPRKWIIDSLLIPPGELRVVFCSNKNITSVTPKDSADRHWRLHTNWRLEKDGGSVYLVDYNWGIRDSVSFPAITPGVSWGIMNGGEWKYFDTPTPEKKNTEGKAYEGFTEPVQLPAGGFYESPITLNAPTPRSGGSIRCTFDGSAPTENSSEFTGSKEIERNMVVRCAEFAENKITNKVSSATFFIGETVDMPVVSISVDPEFLRKHYVKTSASSPSSADPNKTGLYAEVEFPVHVDYFAQGSRTQAKTWEIEAGISLMGNYSRLEDKKSVAVVMREDYQDGRLDYPLFETRKDQSHKFKGFNLRNNGNRFVSDYFEDAMAGAIMEGTGVDYQRSRQVVVFYNGEYYGIHDMREHYNRAYVETNYKIDASQVEMVKHLGRTVTASGDGDPSGYMSMMAFVAQNDFSGANNANYVTVQGMVDIGNFADYMIAEMYAHNGDWPNNNVRAWRSAKQPWKFMMYDLDHGFDWMWNISDFGQSTNIFKWVKQGGTATGKCHGSTDGSCFHTLYVQLSKNPDFKRLFVNHAAVLLQTNLNAENVAKVTDYMASTLISSETERDMAKYNREYRYYQNSCGNGFSISGSCMKEWASERDAIFWNEVASEFGLSTGSIKATIAANGEGIVTIDGKVLPGKTYEGKFFNGNQMLLTAIPSGNAVFSQWEDGSKDNPRLVTPTDGVSYTATFK